MSDHNNNRRRNTNTSNNYDSTSNITPRHSSSSGRIVGGQGTHNRPWILEELEDDPITNTNATTSYDRYLAQRRSSSASASNNNNSIKKQTATITTAVAAAATSNNNNNTNTTTPRRSSSSHEMKPLSTTTSAKQQQAYEQYQLHQRVAAASAPRVETNNITTTMMTPNSTMKRLTAPAAAATTANKTQQHLPSSSTKTHTARDLRAKRLSSSRKIVLDTSSQQQQQEDILDNTNTTQQQQQQQKTDKWVAILHDDIHNNKQQKQKRYQQQQQKQNNNNNEHFQAHDAAVEKYLRRKNAAVTATSSSGEPINNNNNNNNTTITRTRQQQQHRSRSSNNSSSSGPYSNNNNSIPINVPNTIKPPQQHNNIRSQSEPISSSSTTLSQQQQQQQTLNNSSMNYSRDSRVRQQQQQQQSNNNDIAQSSPRNRQSNNIITTTNVLPSSKKEKEEELYQTNVGWSTLKKRTTTNNTNNNINNNNNDPPGMGIANNNNDNSKISSNDNNNNNNNDNNNAISNSTTTTTSTIVRSTIGNPTKNRVTSSGSSKVDQYLARRNLLKQKTSEMARLGKQQHQQKQQQSQHAPAPASAPLISTTSKSSLIAEVPSSTVSFDDDDEEEETSSEVTDESSSSDDDENGPNSNLYDTDDDENDSTATANSIKKWSVKVCIVSAVDLPASVVPNQPFSPCLKIGLVQLLNNTSKTTEELDQICHEHAKLIEQNGLLSLSKTTSSKGNNNKNKIRCTSSKILSKRDNGSVEFHEEIRWDHISQYTNPHLMALAIELSSRAVMTPANINESPSPQKVGPFQLPMMMSSSPNHSIGRTRNSLTTASGTTTPTASGNSGGETGVSRLGSLFRNIRKSDSAEMEEANAAAAVAKLLVQEENDGKSTTAASIATTDSSVTSSTKNLKTAANNTTQSDLKVKLRRRKKKRKKWPKMTEELRIGAKVIPLSMLALDKCFNDNETVRIEQWFELETGKNTVKTSLTGTSPSTSTATRNPSILLEVSFSTPELLDESEDEMDDQQQQQKERPQVKASFSKRASMKIRSQLQKENKKDDEEKVAEPVLEPGIVDYICVVGARDIGDQKADDGSRGWVNSTPKCDLLERFPPTDEFHMNNGRMVALPGKVEWFCFPEGCRLWRGLTPPNHDELNLKRFSASTPAHVSASIAAFDACLGCTTSFSWFVIASNSDEYGSESKKTYGAVIRFFVPAPVGIDPTQDDFGQISTTKTKLSDNSNNSSIDNNGEVKRLWVPMGICITSGLPIIGVLEAILLRLCEGLSSLSNFPGSGLHTNPKRIQEELASLIVNCQKPIPGVVNCSLQFLDGERLHISVSPPKGLPPLPHGNAIASVCRLLGADGLNYILAALLTECKILLHSDDVANLSMVAEVMTALLYPFQWSLPYIPVLPAEMMEFLEAPLSFLLGVPSCNMDLIDPSILEDIVVVDLDRDFASSGFFENKRTGPKTKSPIPLPAAVASNISKAVFRLLRAEDDAVDAYGASSFPGSLMFPRMESESLPEREFRLSVAMELCGLIRGFDECLVFSTSQPVFNVDKFLQMAPSIFEEQRVAASAAHGQSQGQFVTRQVISPCSRRFVSILVCCQHFHQFLQALEKNSTAFFNVIMRSLNTTPAKRDSSIAGRLLSLDSNKTMSDLCKFLQNMEDKTSTYRLQNDSNLWAPVIEKAQYVVSVPESFQFPGDLLQQIVVRSDTLKKQPDAQGVKSVSLEYLVELEKNPWRYQSIFHISGESVVIKAPEIKKITIREAIGDRRYRTWKSSSGFFDSDEASVFLEDSKGMTLSLDLTSLLSTATEEVSSQSIANDDASSSTKDKETLRRCLESLKIAKRGKSNVSEPPVQHLINEAEEALQKPAIQSYLLNILSQRNQEETEKGSESTPGRRRPLQSGGSKLDPVSFEIMIRLAFSMLDSCALNEGFDNAYLLLKYFAGLYTTSRDSDNEVAVVYLTERIGLHPVYANLAVWENVKNKHSASRQQSKKAETLKANTDKSDGDDDNYEAVVATLYEMNGYGIPAEQLARFASRTCETHGWYSSEKGQTLMMLAKRVSIRRDQSLASSTPSKTTDLDLISPSPSKPKRQRTSGLLDTNKLDENSWVEFGWCHPAAQSSRRTSPLDSHRKVTAQSILSRFEESTKSHAREGGKYMNRSAITSLAYLGSSVVVTGGLDGGVFLARRTKSTKKSETTGSKMQNFDIRGIHLDWGSSGSRYTAGSASTSLDGEYGVGAVSCLAVTRSSLNKALSQKDRTKDTICPLEDEEIISSMDGCRVVAGTTCGDLRVWSVRDVFSAVFYATSGGDINTIAHTNSFERGSSGPSSTFAGGRRRGTDFAAGSSLTRLKFSLRGRALSGHRGGVSCIDVHSNVYRPDAIVSGGSDGLIKLWNLRSPTVATGRQRSGGDVGSNKPASPAASDPLTPRSKAARSGDALSILSGHGGRILCLKTAWHGDRLLSGGADRTVRLWDIAGGGGKSVASLSGHFGWVTSVRFWGPNTIISTSTDRSIALWDARVSKSPLFVLRHHNAPVSSLLVGPSNEPVMLSGAVDGTVAAWDFRLLAGNLVSSTTERSARRCRVVRTPNGVFHLGDLNPKSSNLGPVSLSQGANRQKKTAFFLGGDAVIREWDYDNGEIVSETPSGHCDIVSSFVSLGDDKVLGSQLESVGPDTANATISASWDGTVRMRCLS